MYKVYTSYFHRYKEILDSGKLPVNIAIRPPKFFNGPNLMYFAPKLDMLRMPSEAYNLEFKNILSTIDPKRVKNDIEVMQSYFKKDLVLLCFEKDWNICHRKKVAEWLNLKLGMDVTEWNMESVQNPDAEQKTLF